ncbi:MAG: type II secretion system F family protein [Candidatus Dependentiae bacterium]|nr:type II secretion system F family protein [Candidatus Dependentiae bacterium]
MALYSYQAFSKEGKKITGSLDAPSLQSVKEQLTRQGLFPTAIELAKDQLKQSWWQRLFSRGVPVKEKIMFTKQLAILLKSGVPLLQALELLADQFEGTLHSILVTVKDNLKEGVSFADALKNYPNVFDNIYVQLVRAGEASGKLEVILERLTSYIERREAIRKKVSSALQYPLMQLAVAVLVIGVLVVFVVPKMAENFKGGQELPGPTRFLLSISDFVSGHFVLLIIGLILLVIAWKSWSSTSSGARTIDEIKLRLPLIKYFVKTNAVVQFSYTLGMLLEGGVNLAESLDIVVKIIDNRVLADTLNQARDKIIKQGKIAQYLKQTNIFPPIAIHLISTGEQSGQLDSMLLTVAQNYEEDLGELADGLTAALGPILLIVMAVIVGFIVIAVALPITQMGNIAGI